MRIRLSATLLPTLALMIGASGCANAAGTNEESESAEKSAVEQVSDYKPADIIRLTPAEVQPLVQQGKALLVCAYDSDEKFESIRVEGAISFGTFEKKLPDLAKDALLVFY